MKLEDVVCPDGTTPNAEGTACELCRMGTAGTGGVCEKCAPGMTTRAEGCAHAGGPVRVVIRDASAVV